MSSRALNSGLCTWGAIAFSHWAVSSAFQLIITAIYHMNRHVPLHFLCKEFENTSDKMMSSSQGAGVWKVESWSHRLSRIPVLYGTSIFISFAFLKRCLTILPRLIDKVRSRRIIGRPQFLPEIESNEAVWSWPPECENDRASKFFHVKGH